ncbi:MAG TPA: hypothetical protein ENG40_03320, partial [Thermoprotei archaeon]|nr:hypothetical protein [Thermoprotei archaeon]
MKRMCLVFLLIIILSLYPNSFVASNNIGLVILSVPHYYQEKWYFCGPACVQMVLHYISGIKVSQYTLANEMHTSSSSGGTYTNYMPKPFRLRGYRVTEIKPMSIDKLKYYLRQNKPIIILVWFDTRKTCQHYVVVIGYDDNGVYIHDPWPEKWGKAKNRNTGSFVYISYSMLLQLWKCDYPLWGLVVDKKLPILSFSLDSPIDIEIKIDVKTQLIDFWCKVKKDETILIGFRPGKHKISVNRYIKISDNSRLSFTKWSDGDKDNTKTLSIRNNNIVLKAFYSIQYYVAVFSKYGKVYGKGWYYKNSIANISISKTIISLSKGARYVLKGWMINNKFIATNKSKYSINVIS